MASMGGIPEAERSTPRALAFYLPQFHPIPENDLWWGKGFTEWTNVTRTQPLFPGHYQPHVPGELGYYDLRVPEVREAQAALAREHGISGFIYYHYWFHGKRLLNRPFDDVLASGSPDLPFALCWANEEWTRNWDAKTGEVLMPQEFSDEDDLAHIRWLSTAFSDDRYIKIDGRPLMLIYRPGQLPDPKRTAEIWRTEAQRLGFPDLYLCWVESHGQPAGGPEAFGLDATVGFMPTPAERIFAPLEALRNHRLIDYKASYEAELDRTPPPWKRFPSVMVGWDNTARRQRGATIFDGATPEAYQRWLRRTVDSVGDVRDEENLLFILAWNEWAEGNHLEPDLHHGRAFLEATRAVLLDVPGTTSERGELRLPSGADSKHPTAEVAYDYVYPFDHESAVANAAELIRGLSLGTGATIVDLGAGTAVISHALRGEDIDYHALEVHPVAVDLMQQAGVDATQCDLTDTDEVLSVLDDIGNVRALLLLDVLEHLLQPQALLSALSAWALKHDETTLVVSVPNATHFDLGLRLLCGRWVPKDTGLLDSTHLRFYSEVTLERMFERCGWQVVDRNNFSTMRTDQYDPELNDALPSELLGALHVLSESFNPSTAVQQFIWALRPFPVGNPPLTYLDAVGGAEGLAEGEENDGQAVRSYLVSTGLIASETNRRAAKHLRFGLVPRWKRAFQRKVIRSPRSAAVYKRIRSLLP